MKKILIVFSILLLSMSVLNAQDVNVTFQVDMRGQILSGNFDPATEVVTVPGGFNNWLNEPPANDTKTMDDGDGDSVYTKTIAMAPNATYEYKYNIGLGWDGKDEQIGGNRSVDVGGTDLTVPVVWYNNQSVGGSATVTFNVDMNAHIASGEFNPDSDFVDVDGVHAGDVGALAAAGITRGCNPVEGNTRFCPKDAVTRENLTVIRTFSKYFSIPS